MSKLETKIGRLTRVERAACGGCSCTVYADGCVPGVSYLYGLRKWKRHTPATYRRAAIIVYRNIVKHRAAVPDIRITDVAADIAAA